MLDSYQRLIKIWTQTIMKCLCFLFISVFYQYLSFTSLCTYHHYFYFFLLIFSAIYFTLIQSISRLQIFPILHNRHLRTLVVKDNCDCFTADLLLTLVFRNMFPTLLEDLFQKFPLTENTLNLFLQLLPSDDTHSISRCRLFQ